MKRLFFALLLARRQGHAVSFSIRQDGRGRPDRYRPLRPHRGEDRCRRSRCEPGDDQDRQRLVVPPVLQGRGVFGVGKTGGQGAACRDWSMGRVYAYAALGVAQEWRLKHRGEGIVIFDGSAHLFRGQLWRDLLRTHNIFRPGSNPEQAGRSRWPVQREHGIARVSQRGMSALWVQELRPVVFES